MEWLPDIDVRILGGAAAVAVVLALAVQITVIRLRRELEAMAIDRADSATGLLPPGAIQLRLEPELDWAAHEGVPVGIIIFHIKGSFVNVAARALQEALRGEENAYRLSHDRVLVGLWNTTERGMAAAAQRLGEVMKAASDVVVEAGSAMFPKDATSIAQLRSIATAGLRPLAEQDVVPAADSQPRIARSALRRSLRSAIAVAPGVVIAAMSYAAFTIGVRSSIHSRPRPDDLRTQLLVAAGISIAWALAVALTWNRGASGEPRSSGRPRRVTRLGTCALAALPALALVWAIRAPAAPDQLPLLSGVSIVLAMQIMLVIGNARFLVRAISPVLIVIGAAGAALVYLGLHTTPDIANAGRLIVACAGGALIARAVERLSWMLFLCVGIGAVDMWSVFSSSGTTHKLLTSGSHLLDILLLTGPPIDGRPILFLGTTDLVFLAAFCCIAHAWQLPVFRTIAALTIGLCVAMMLSGFTSIGIPVLPFLAAAFVAANIVPLLRSVFGRRRSGSERAATSVSRRRAVAGS